MTPVLYDPRQSVDSCLKANRDFIRACHDKFMPADEIGKVLGIPLSMSSTYAAFHAAEVARKDFGLLPLQEARRNARVAELSEFRDRVTPRGDKTAVEFMRANAALIEDMHQADVKLKDIGLVLGFSGSTTANYLTKAELNRKAFNLPPLQGESSQPKGSLMPRLWTESDDAQIRRAHYCHFPVSAVGAICRRNGLEISARAREIGLGDWPREASTREKLALAADYDARHDPSELGGDIRRDGRGPTVLSKSESYLK